ncbi:MAG: penicillin-binding protein activator, partial [Thiohalocapsa sp.]|uniref:penicillin-binding protein activator n=1 Tax=Thiohalocapsa sp. TaxID=2497641 RepID=UPI0025E0B365
MARTTFVPLSLIPTVPHRAPPQAWVRARAARWLGVALACAMALAGCAINPAQDAQRVLADVPQAALAKARGLEQAGESAEAAAAYLQLAEKAASPAKEQLQLDAARSLLAAGDATEATSVLTDINKGKLTAAQREQVLLLEAALAMQRGRASEALSTLKRVNKRSLPADLKTQYLGTEAAAYRLSGQPMRAAESLNELDGVLKGDTAARMDNQVSLLFTLATLGSTGLDDAIRKSHGRMKGWAELARLFSQYGAPSPKLDAAFRKWRSSHIGHPALANLPQAYFATLAGGYPAGTEVRVLLPRGGRFGVAGDAVKDGIQAAYDADHGGNRPELRYGGSYNAGVDAGADLVVGPLEKPAVAQLAARSSLPVPTLALNRAGGGATENLYQFSLAPEDEAYNAANYAKNAGFTRAALLYPDDGFGARLANAFRSRWRTLGGNISVQHAYRSRPGGYGSDAAALLAGGKADFIFMVSTAGDAVPLYGALREADNRLPVVSTSHVYNGAIDPARDAALSGLYFVDIPWILDSERSDALSRKALRDRLPNVSGPLARLYAMGIDAYRLAPR